MDQAKRSGSGLFFIFGALLGAVAGALLGSTVAHGEASLADAASLAERRIRSRSPRPRLDLLAQ